MKFELSSRAWVAGGILTIALVSLATQQGWILDQDAESIKNVILGAIGGGALGIGINQVRK